MDKKPIDPRTTRRTIERQKYERNSALFSTYEVIEKGPTIVVLQKKAEHCVRREERAHG